MSYVEEHLPILPFIDGAEEKRDAESAGRNGVTGFR